MAKATPDFIFDGKRMKEAIEHMAHCCTLLTVCDDIAHRKEIIQELLIPCFSEQRAIIGYEILKNAKNPEVKAWFKEVAEEMEREE